MEPFHLDLLGDVLADRTRRGIYLYVKHQREPVSVNQVAEAFDMHRNAVKFHLDKLLEAGLLIADFRRINGRRGPGAGRPSKLYSASDVEVSFTVPERRYDLLATLLLRALTSGECLEDVGLAFGRSLAEDTRASCDDGVECARDLLASLGFEPTIEVDAEGMTWITTENCPFGKVAMDAPDAQVCSLDHAIVRGILESFGGRVEIVEHASMAHGHDTCVREVRFRAS